jgi:hypothetical protein
MATAAAAAGVASLRYFPSSLRHRSFPGPIRGGGVVTFSPRRGRCASAAAVAAPSREAEPSSSLGDLARVDFPILDQVIPYLSPSHPVVWKLASTLLVPSGTSFEFSERKEDYSSSSNF